MGHERGHIVQGHTIIYDPVGVGEVCSVLGTNHADVGWVCTRATLINKWAKYKPVKNTENNYQSQLKANNTWKSQSELPSGTVAWWKAYNEKFGLVVNTYNNGSDMVSGWDSNWAYDAITINSSNVTSHWCRITDFNYYDKDANPFVSVTAPHIYYTNSAGGLTVQFYFDSSDYQLTVTDFANAGFWLKTQPQRLYCGALVAYGSELYANCYKVWATNSHAIGESMTPSEEGSGLWNRTVIVPKAQMPSGSTNYVTVYPFIVAEEQYNSSTASTTDATFGSQTGKGVVPCPVAPLSLIAAMSSISGEFVVNSIVCEALGSGGGFDIKFDYTITGYGDFSATIFSYLAVLDADPDTDGTYPEDSKIQRYHILNYGEQNVYNPRSGNSYPVSLNNTSETLNQKQVMGQTGTGAITMGVDSATYINNYKTKHSTNTAKLRICVILAVNGYDWHYNYYTQTVSGEVTISE